MTTALLAIALLIVLNGLFAMTELAIMTARKPRLAAAAAQGNRAAEAALQLSREPSRFLSTIQIGITLIGILAGAFGEKSLSAPLEALYARVPLLAPHADTLALATVVIAITYFSLVIGELIPKRLAIAFPEAMAMLLARPVALLSVLAAIPVSVLTLSTDLILRVFRVPQQRTEDISEHDVRAVLARAAGVGVFLPQELALFQRTMRVGDLRVRDIMVPRSQIAWLEEDQPLSAVRTLLATNPYSHFPVATGSLDTITGFVHVKDLIPYSLLGGTEDVRPADVARKPTFVPETMPALQLLDHFRDTGEHIAFVVDEYGGTEGMVTLRDLTNAVVGDLTLNPTAHDASLRRRKDGSLLAIGRTPIHELDAALSAAGEIDNAFPGVTTLSGFISAVLGHIPAEGEVATWQSNTSTYTFKVIDMHKRRIDKVLITQTTPANELPS